jgi:hypothetical protein
VVTRTALQLVTDSLKLIGVVAGHEVPTASEQQDSFARLAELVDSWGTHAQTLLVQRRTLVPLTSGVQTYAWGPGEVINEPTPMTIDAVSYLVPGSTPTEVFLGLGSDQAYIEQTQKALVGGPPQQVTYSRTHGPGELWVWPVPGAGVTLACYWKEPLQQFPDLVTPVTLAPGYAKAIRTNLAIELAPEFGRVVDPVVERSARESLADIKRANVVLVEVGIDRALTGGGGSYDILSDT